MLLITEGAVTILEKYHHAQFTKLHSLGLKNRRVRASTLAERLSVEIGVSATDQTV